MNTNLQTTRTDRLRNLVAVKLLMVTLLGWLLFCAAAAEAQPPPSSDNTASPADRGNRSTSTANSVQALVEQGMLDRAEQVAREQLNAAVLSSDEAAKAAVALAGVRVAKLLRAPLDQQQAHLDAAIEPLQRVLRAYPDHRRSPWLRFQSCAIDIAVAQRQAAVLAATPGDERQRLAVLATLIERSRDLQELEGKVSEQIAVAFDRRDRSPWIDELMALRNAIAVQRVEVLLRRGELFAAGSDDALAAAAEAQQAAIAAQGLVRDDAARQADLLRMRCEALLRMGQPDQAAELLQPLLNGEDEPSNAENRVIDRQLDDATLALAVRLALELNELNQAGRLLASHYGERPAEAVAAPESDLARLRYLIAAGTQSAGAEQSRQEVGDWIEAIRRRGGDFAQRRAETIVIELLGPSSAPLSDPRIVIAAAAQQLRAGHAMQAAERLATAARQTDEPAAAQQLAVAGAAAYSSVGEHLAAGKLLLEIAQAHQHEPGAAELHLQAAVLLERHGRAKAADISADSAVADPVNELLRQTLQLWPSEPAAQQARRWLVARLIAGEKHVEAAIATTPRDDPAATEEQWAAAAAAWSEALASVPLVTADLAVNPAVERLAEQALEHFPADVPAAEHGRRRLSVLFGEAAVAATPEPTDGSEPFIDWLLAVRRGALGGAPPPATAPETRQLAVQRLVADAIAAPAKRTHLAATILQLEGDAATLPRAMALVWSNRWREADELLDRRVQTDANSEQTAITAATVLSRSSQPDAKRRALARFAAVGATLAQGSTAWHEVKLATLELLSELDQQPEAARLAQYILLTRPPEDPAVKARYQRWSEP